MTPRECILSAAARFRSDRIPDPENDSALLLASLIGGSPLSLRLDMETILSEDTLLQYERLVSRRLKRVPLQYILGEAPFCGHSFLVTPDVLIPRPETEWLCLWAQELLEKSPSSRVLDLCCGSGCIGLSLKAAFPALFVTLSDLSKAALQIAERNMKKLSVSATLHQGDLLEGFPPSTYDLIVTNPPYISTKDCGTLQREVLFEPRLALDGGLDGLTFYRRIIRSALSVLAEGGSLLMELGAGEAEPVKALLTDCGYRNIRIRKDLAGIDRMICAIKPYGGANV